jgi:hypothetical protein
MRWLGVDACVLSNADSRGETMRKKLAPLFIAAVLIAASATVANAASVTASPGGGISATIRGLGFSGFLIGLFTCDVTLGGSVSTGPIVLPGNGGSISSASISGCSGGHSVAARSLPWTLTAQTALSRCPSASTGLLGTVAASFTIDGFVTSSGPVGTLVSSGRGSISLLRSTLSNSGQVLGGSGTYSPVNTIACT